MNKIVRLMVILSIAASLTIPQAVFAAGTGDNPNLTLDIPTAKQVKAMKEKQKFAKEYAENLKARHTGGIGTMSLGEIKTISVTGFEQETSYWCGPATTKQVLHFLNGSSQSQTYYANELGTTTDGTDFSLIDDVLNDQQTENTYVYSDYDSTEFLSWKTAMILSIDWGNPSVLDLKITPQTMPLYTSTVQGHILNTSGYDAVDDDDLKLRVTDPFDQGNRGVTLGNNWYDMEGVWDANQAHFRKAILW